MKTHNRIIYHCLNCGNVVHADLENRPPDCCHFQMVRAAIETIWGADDPEQKPTDEYETACPVSSVGVKPR